MDVLVSKNDCGLALVVCLLQLRVAHNDFLTIVFDILDDFGDFFTVCVIVIESVLTERNRQNRTAFKVDTDAHAVRETAVLQAENNNEHDCGDENDCRQNSNEFCIVANAVLFAKIAELVLFHDYASFARVASTLLSSC